MPAQAGASGLGGPRWSTPSRPGCSLEPQRIPLRPASGRAGGRRPRPRADAHRGAAPAPARGRLGINKYPRGGRRAAARPWRPARPGSPRRSRSESVSQRSDRSPGRGQGSPAAPAARTSRRPRPPPSCPPLASRAAGRREGRVGGGVQGATERGPRSCPSGSSTLCWSRGLSSFEPHAPGSRWTRLSGRPALPGCRGAAARGLGARLQGGLGRPGPAN